MTTRVLPPEALGIPAAIPLPVRQDWRIGLVGFGSIAFAHAEAYTSVGWRVVAVADPDPAARGRASTALPGVRLYDDYPALVADPQVEVIALLTQPTLREPVVAAAARARKPILTEKPLATTLEQAERMVRLAESAGIPFAVSQNYRWAGANFFARHLIARGLIGSPFYLCIEIHGNQDVGLAAHPFYSTCPDFLTIQWNNHLVDLLRCWVGSDAHRVWATTRRMTGQNFVGDNLLLSIADFGPGVTGHIVHSELCHSTMTESRCRIEGDHGTLLFPLCGTGLQVQAESLGAETITLDTSGCRQISSFCGPMGELLCSIEEQREPETSARHNLGTIRHVLAEHESTRSGGVWVLVG